MEDSSYEGLATLKPDGSVPDTRMRDAMQVVEMVNQAISRDKDSRDWKRARVKGLVDGNPPYKHSALVAAGRADACNVNWRIAKYFLGLAQQMVYDVITEAETLTTVQLANDNPQNDDWSQQTTRHFQWLQEQDLEGDSCTQLHQGNMVLYGPGPVMFQDTLDWRTCHIDTRCLLLDERAKSITNRWEWAAVQVDYAPDQLYSRIRNPKIAGAMGWNVAATRKSIIAAHPISQTGNSYAAWSWHQDQLKNGTLHYSSQAKAVRCAHFYFREFPTSDEDEDGRISEVVVDLDMGSPDADRKNQFLFRKLRRYKNWNEVIHPFYWMHDVNGYHYSVNGLGLEMYSALEYENRLLCKLADDAFAPSLFFKPSTASDKERMHIAQVGRYAILPAALEMVQQHFQPFLNEGMAMSREIQQLVSSNLSQFRSNAMTKQQGNPVTARQIDYEASEQAKMGKTQLARIYEQYDWLYKEKFRRATNPDYPDSARGGKLAAEFIKRCTKSGIPREALNKVEYVKATRVIGQGSAFMRQQALEFLLGLLGILPEAGRSNLIRDVVSARAGHSHVERYAPRENVDPKIEAQRSDAMQQVASMKVGVPATPVSTQNPAIYATTFVEAMDGAVQAIQQGGNPQEGVAFLDLALPATMGHIQKLQQDKSRTDLVKSLTERVKAIDQFSAQVKDQLAQMAQEQQQAAQQVAQMRAGTDPKTQVDMAKVAVAGKVKAAKLQADTALKGKKQQADMAMKADQHKFNKALKDAQTADDIARKARTEAANNDSKESKSND